MRKNRRQLLFTCAAFLGLTFGCARCHNHKYDPITQHDYFALQAVFAASDRPFPSKVRDTRIKALNGLLSDAPIPKEKLHDPRCTVQTEEKTGFFHLFHRAQPLEVHRLHRGELNKPREEIKPAFPAFFRGAASKPDFNEFADRLIS